MSVNKRTRDLCTVALLGAVSVVLGYVEMLIPLPVRFPGVKLGLANLAILLAVWLLDTKKAAVTALIKTVLSALLFAGFSGFLFSLVGTVLSFTVTVLCKKSGQFSPIGAGIAGGIAHNVGQILVAFAILNGGVFSYLPFLLIAGGISGAITGGICLATMPLLKRIFK